jgi:hypothetical protein
MWVAHNGVVHEKVVNGLAIAEAAGLEVNIHVEYLLGPNDWMITINGC